MCMTVFLRVMDTDRISIETPAATTPSIGGGLAPHEGKGVGASERGCSTTNRKAAAPCFAVTAAAPEGNLGNLFGRQIYDLEIELA